MKHKLVIQFLKQLAIIRYRSHFICFTTHSVFTFLQEINKQESNVCGDVLVAAAIVTYCGAFTNEYRQKLIDIWIKNCHQLEIPISENLTLVNVLSNPYEIQQWNTVGLPKDEVSIDNAIMVTRGYRWPLMIDPQEQVL